MKRKTTEESGLTLVEILASLVILGIVFVAFMTIFPQMTLFNNRTETKLETMNEARVILEEYKSYSIDFSELQGVSCTDDSLWLCTEDTAYPDAIIRIKKEAEPPMNTISNPMPGVVKLHRIHIKMMKNNQLISESFGYVKAK
ncbi:type II secretion system protein [Sporosarcina sp. Sa3CUA8]|uniref:Type II secretion system protein n=2 Tax=Sporosarcina gallistercoris TaxID=2762245 RepID=A0ABR8PJQ2_9BACL|nr:type II secretion system protein [Sporosarcina gallistercoris]